MIKYRGKHLLRTGLIGGLLALLVVAVGLQPQRIVQWATTVRYQAVFSEAGGLEAGNPVKISGMEVGRVGEVALEHADVIVTFTVDAKVPLGSQTTAHIGTGTLLGERMLTLASSGPESLAPLERIPSTRTSSPYSLTDAVGDLTRNTADTDTDSLNQSLDLLSTTIDRLAPQLTPMFDGLTRMSKSLNNRDQTLTDLLAHTAEVTDVLAQRSDSVNTLLLDANHLTDVLNQRRYAIVGLLADTSALAQQLSGLIDENDAELRPSLDKLNAVIAVLERNRDNLAKALPGLAKYQSGLSELVASGPYYEAYIPNLTQGSLLQPFLDYAFGFRRGTDAGQPPDDVGPRAEIPFPYNGIPGGR